MRGTDRRAGQGKGSGTSSVRESHYVRTNPTGYGVWLYRYRDGEWTCKQWVEQRSGGHVQLVHAPSDRAIYVKEWDHLAGVPDGLMEAVCNPLPTFEHLVGSVLEWKEPSATTAMACMLFAPPGLDEAGTLDWPVFASLLYYLNAPENIVLSSLAHGYFVEDAESIRRFSGYRAWDVLTVPYCNVRGDKIELSAQLVFPRRKQMGPAVTMASTPASLPEDLAQWSRRILEAIGVDTDVLDIPQMKRVLFKDYESMLMHTELARSIHDRDLWERTLIRWFRHDPWCPFSWSLNFELLFGRRLQAAAENDQESLNLREIVNEENRRRLGWNPPIGYWYHDYVCHRIPGFPWADEKDLVDALQRCPHHHGARWHLIEGAFERGDYELIERLLAGAEVSSPQRWPWQHLKGCLLHVRGQYAEAARHWSDLPRTDESGKPHEVYLVDTKFSGGFEFADTFGVDEMYAYELVHAGDYMTAIPLLREAVLHRVERDERFDTLICAYLYACCQAGQPTKATEFAEWLQSKHEKELYREAAYHLGVAYLLCGHRGKAREILGTSLRGRVGLEWSPELFIPNRYELLRIRQRLQERRSLFGL